MLIMYWSRNESIAHCEHDGIFILELALKVVVRVNSLLAHVQASPLTGTQWPGL